MLLARCVSLRRCLPKPLDPPVEKWRSPHNILDDLFSSFLFARFIHIQLHRIAIAIFISVWSDFQSHGIPGGEKHGLWHMPQTKDQSRLCPSFSWQDFNLRVGDTDCSFRKNSATKDDLGVVVANYMVLIALVTRSLSKCASTLGPQSTLPLQF
jgi:hypothetical protein